MNLTKIYNDNARRIDELSAKPIQEDLAAKQLKINWLDSTPTKEMMKSLSDQAEGWIEEASALANTYHQHENHIQIINLLVKAKVNKNIIKTYGVIS